MAIIQKIRNRSGLMLVVIGGCLLLFVLSDALTGKGQMYSDDPNELGEVNGTTIETKEYNDFVENIEFGQQRQNQGMPLNDYQKQSIRERAWNLLVDFSLVEEECKEIGITSSDDEIAEIFYNPNNQLSYKVAEILQISPENTEQLREAIKNSSDARVESEVNKSEKQIRKQLDYIKYQSLLKAGFVSTKSEAKYQYETHNENIEFELASLSYGNNTIPDSAIKVTDEELQAAYEKNKSDYKRKEGRDIKFLLFPQTPSAKDEAELVKRMEEVKARFAVNKTNDANFVNSESDANKGYNGKFFKKSDGLPAAVDSNFNSLAEGQLFGPYKEYDGGAGREVYRVSKILKVKQLADSVKVKHILLSLRGLPEVPGSDKFPITTEEKLISTADSLYKKLQKDQKNDALFNEMIVKHSDDINTKTTGGDLGWVNSTNKYSYMFDSCMLANVGGIFKIIGRDGIHLVKVVQHGVPMKKVNVGTISVELRISDQTKAEIQAQAHRAADLLKNKKENIDTLAIKNNYRLIPQKAVGKHDLYVQGLTGAREIVKWAYNAEVGDVSNEFDIAENYVVVTLEKEYEEGFKPWDDEDVKRELEIRVRNEKRGAIFQKKLNDALAKGVKTLQDLKAYVPELLVEKSAPVRISDNGFMGSNESAVVGMLGALKAKQMSKAIVGKSGVYVVFVISKSGLLPISDYTQEIEQLNAEKRGIPQQQQGLVDKMLGDALKTNADIEDYRFEKLD